MNRTERNDCSLQGICGGCTYYGMEYEEQLGEKEAHIRGILSDAAREDFIYEGIIRSPLVFCYRNKMEYSFGDEKKNGPLTLGLHKKRSFYDVVNTDGCLLVHPDFNAVVQMTREYFGALGLTYKDKRTHRGYLRHLLIRRAVHTGELLIDLITTTQPLIPVDGHGGINDMALYVQGERVNGMDDVTGEDAAKPQVFSADRADRDDAKELQQAPKKKKRGRSRDNFPPLVLPVRTAEGVQTLDEKEILNAWKERILKLKEDGVITGTIRGILHTKNDSPSDAIKNEGTETLYGEGVISETLLGLRFQITPFSFFQTNSKGAEVLYEKARSYVADALHTGDTVYDLYSGTGTIAQMLAPCVHRVIGVEIVEEAVEAAKRNAAENGLKNCEFLAGDVFQVLDQIEEKPDVIILDPPRDGVNPKALQKIIGYGVKTIVYISCKCESLCRDMIALQASGYKLLKAASIDQFPWTGNIETVVLFSKGEIDSKKVRVEFSLEDMDMSGFQKDATYSQIKERVLQQTGLKVSSLYIAQVSRNME